MNPSSPAPTPSSFAGTLAKALQTELDQLKQTRAEITLFSGEFAGSIAEYFYYRFEVPEGLYLRGVERVLLTFGQLQPVTIEGRIISLESQFLTVALPMDFGAVLPEITCSWSFEDKLKPILEALNTVTDSHPVVSALFHPDAPANVHASGFEPTFCPSTPPDLQDAVKKALGSRVSFVWGPVSSGKTTTLGLTALNLIKAGKKVLVVASTQDEVDQLVLRMFDLASELGVDIKNLGTRVGLPRSVDAQLLVSFLLEHEIAEKKSLQQTDVEERQKLLITYWRTKVNQFLHEDFYAKLTDLRERSNENRKQLAKVADDLKVSKETIRKAQSASVLEKLKKGFSNEEVVAAQKDQAEKQALQKRLQSIQQALTTELIRAESQVPIDSNEMRDFYAASKRLGELGGVVQVTEGVEAMLRANEQELLASKRLVATTVDSIFSDPRLRKVQFDTAVVDGAENIPLPYLAALGQTAAEKMIIAGDPFQLGPEPSSSGDFLQTLLQQGGSFPTPQTDQPHRLFEWSQKNSRWCIFLSSQFIPTPKLSGFVASVFYDDKLKVAQPSGAKGKVYFFDTSDLRSSCRQYLGRKRIVPYNDAQTKRTIEIVKHALMQPHRQATDIGVVVPFPGTSLHTKLQFRLHGLRNIEVGTPVMAGGRRKKAVIFDTTMAGVDYTMRHIDDRKIGEHRIARLFNTLFACVEEDLYIVADLSHFATVYKNRLFTKILMLLQSLADPLPAYSQAAKQFDALEWDARSRILDLPHAGTPGATGDVRSMRAETRQKADAELEMRMRLLARQQPQPPSLGARDFERETCVAVRRVLGMIKDVNLLSQHIGGDVLFRHSLATEQSAAQLPLEICRNEEEFRKIMERWNLVMYEMSGAGKTDLSFFAKQTPEASVRWDISRLRAYYSSTVEAAVEEGKHRVAVSVSKVFQECLGKPQPANPVEWSTAYLNFLGRMEAYVTWISEQLRK